MMSMHSEFVSELTKDITSAAERGDWDAAKADLTVLSEQIVQVFIDRRDQDRSQAGGCWI